MTKFLLAAMIALTTLSAGSMDFKPIAAHAGAAADRMAAEYEPVQLAALASVIRSAGHACPSASKLLYMGDMEAQNAGFWTVQCPAGDFVVMISNLDNMKTIVLDCTISKSIGATCWKPL